MFITKKAYEKALHEVKCEVENQCERKMLEREERMWRDNEMSRTREDYTRHLNELEKRIYALEKNAGLVKEDHCCPYANAVAPRY